MVADAGMGRGLLPASPCRFVSPAALSFQGQGAPAWGLQGAGGAQQGAQASPQLLQEEQTLVGADATPQVLQDVALAPLGCYGDPNKAAVQNICFYYFLQITYVTKTVFPAKNKTFQISNFFPHSVTRQ